jgi:hypothetical protein
MCTATTRGRSTGRPSRGGEADRAAVQEERGQGTVLLVDCGRHMRAVAPSAQAGGPSSTGRSTRSCSSSRSRWRAATAWASWPRRPAQGPRPGARRPPAPAPADAVFHLQPSAVEATRARAARARRAPSPRPAGRQRRADPFSVAHQRRALAAASRRHRVIFAALERPRGARWHTPRTPTRRRAPRPSSSRRTAAAPCARSRARACACSTRCAGRGRGPVLAARSTSAGASAGRAEPATSSTIHRCDARTTAPDGVNRGRIATARYSALPGRGRRGAPSRGAGAPCRWPWRCAPRTAWGLRASIRPAAKASEDQTSRPGGLALRRGAWLRDHGPGDRGAHERRPQPAGHSAWISSTPWHHRIDEMAPACPSGPPPPCRSRA